MKQIVSGVYEFTGLLVGRVYLLEGEDGLTIIDAGIALAPKRIVGQLEAAGYTASDVKRILLTHAHPDHAGGLPELKALTGAQVMCSAIERPVAEGTQPIPTPPKASLSAPTKFMVPPPTKLKGTPIDRDLSDGETLPEVLGGLEVVFTPGHSPGHLAFWQAERRILFCGDVIMNIRGLRLPLRFVTVDMAEDKRSIARVVGLEPNVVCFGHGEPLTQNVPSQLRAFARKVGAVR